MGNWDSAAGWQDSVSMIAAGVGACEDARKARTAA